MKPQISTKKTLLFCVTIFVLFFHPEIFTPSSAQNLNEGNLIPSWFKINVNWWQEEKISDDEIINAIEFLWYKEIIKIDSNKIEKIITQDSNSSPFPNENQKKTIIDLKQMFGLWQAGSVSDIEIVNTIIQLINNGTINNLDYTSTKLSAAIIDIVDDLSPNRLAQQKTKQFLEQAGYKVDIFTANDATVDFYKNLPSMNYNFIYLRTHSLAVPELDDATFLFTGEKYDIDKYFSEQISGQLARGTPFYYEESLDIEKNSQAYNREMFFMISSKFVDEKMQGYFPNSIIVIGGCESVKNLDIASSLISRGASTVIGWTNPILAGENDRAMLTLFEEMLINKSDIENSIETVMNKYGSNFKYDSELRYVQP